MEVLRRRVRGCPRIGVLGHEPLLLVARNERVAVGPSCSSRMQRAAEGVGKQRRRAGSVHVGKIHSANEHISAVTGPACDTGSMSQFSLFEQPRGVLVDDKYGRITYAPDFVDTVTAGAWFEELRTSVSWRSQRRRMYDREVDVPRLTGHYWLEDPPGRLPASIAEAAAMVTAYLQVPFTAVGLNLYRDGRDSVAPHNDHLNELREGFPIALLSLGATRRMTIRQKTAPHALIHVDLAAGSLLVMDYATQRHYTHGVPKTTTPVGTRISLAFRVKPVADKSQPLAT